MSCLSPLISLLRLNKSNSTENSTAPTTGTTIESTQKMESSSSINSSNLPSIRGGCFCGHDSISSRQTAPPSYPSLTQTPQVPIEVNEEIVGIEETIKSLSIELRKLSLEIHDHPEIAWKEFKTHDLCCNYLESKGFKVKRNAYGLETAWEATFEFGKGGRVVGFNSEMDALPGIGHACGHNLICISGIAAAIAFAQNLVKFKIPGKVILLGTPAEEVDGGKINLINAGAYKPMDVCLMLHPAPMAGVAPSLAIAECVVNYEGHTAHSAASPWEGINAQDAAVLAYTNLSALRQQLHFTHRVHGVIVSDPSWVANVIPGTSKLVFGVRCPTLAEVDILKVRVENCFKAAGLATGCKMKLDWVMCYYDLRNNEGMGEEYLKYMKGRQGQVFNFIDSLGGSTDFGNVSYELPALHPLFDIPNTFNGSGNHTIGFTAAARTEEAHEQTLKAAMGISVVGWGILRDDKFAMKVKKEFEDRMGARE